MSAGLVVVAIFAGGLSGLLALLAGLSVEKIVLIYSGVGLATSIIVILAAYLAHTVFPAHERPDVRSAEPNSRTIDQPDRSPSHENAPAKVPAVLG